MAAIPRTHLAVGGATDSATDSVTDTDGITVKDDPSAHTAGGTTAANEQVGRPAWAHYLVSLRHRHELSARETAERMGVTPQTYAGIEAGTRLRNGRRVEIAPKDDTLHRIAEALDLTPAERRHLYALVTTSAQGRKPWQTRLRMARIAAAMSQSEAAHAAGVTTSTYGEWERRTSGVPKHDSLRRLLTHLGWTVEQVDEFIESLPPDTAPVRAPRQPTNPVRELPQWSQFITAKRLDAGLYLSQVDALVGQQSVVRRFELGGWPRSDGRLSVPSYNWLARIADALGMTSDEHAHLNLLADHHRLAVAAQSHRPLIAELLHEARKAIDVTRTEANTRVGFPPGTWNNLELGNPDTLGQMNTTCTETAIERLPIGPLLAAALRASVPNKAEPADNTNSSPVTDTSEPALN